MKKNDEWIFFLYYDDVNDTYWCTGDFCGRVPFYSEEISNLMDKYLQLRGELDELLGQCISIPYDDIDRYYNEGKIIFYNSEHTAFALDKGESEGAMKILNEMNSIYLHTEPDLFGVYSIESVNLDLYSEIVQYFDLKPQSY